MKRLFSFATVLVLLFSLCACGSSLTADDGEATEDESTVISETDEMSDAISNENVTNTSSAALTGNNSNEFVANEDLRIVFAFGYDKDTYIVVENVGEQAILNYRVAYIAFDKNGFVATQDSKGYDTGRHDTVNLMPGEKKYFFLVWSRWRLCSCCYYWS